MFLTVRYMGCYYHFHCCMDYCRPDCNHHTADSGCNRRYMVADSGCNRRYMAADSGYKLHTAGSDIHHYTADYILLFRCTC